MQFFQVLSLLVVANVAFATVTLENEANENAIKITKDADVVNTVEQSVINVINNIPVDVSKKDKIVRRIVKLKEEIAVLERTIATQVVVVTEQEAEQEVVEEKAGKDGKKKDKKKEKKVKKDKKVKQPKESKEAKQLAKKKTELQTLESEFSQFGLDFAVEAAQIALLDQKIVDKKLAKTELKQLAVDWASVWLSHPDNAKKADFAEAEVKRAVDVVELKIKKLEYKLLEERAKLAWLKEREAQKQIQLIASESAESADSTGSKEEVSVD